MESGDRLTRSEFERRYAAMPQVKKAELIEGVVSILQQGLVSADHAAYVAKLTGATKSNEN